MLIKPSQTTDEGPTRGAVCLLRKSPREMKENLAREYFDMSLDEFRTGLESRQV